MQVFGFVNLNVQKSPVLTGNAAILADVMTSNVSRPTTLYNSYNAYALTVRFMLSEDYGSEIILRNIDVSSPSAASHALQHLRKSKC